jgi:thioredoxin
MKRAEFQRKLKTNPRPIIVDLWAPWCKPCRAMEPAFKQISQKYQGQVDVLKVNADESPDVLKFLGVMGIPTVVGFVNGAEILRRTEMQSTDGLDILFDATLHKRKPAIMPPAPIDRLICTAVGLVVLALGWSLGYLIVGLVVGGILIFSAFYDRCPIYKTILPRVTALFQRPKSSQ